MFFFLVLTVFVSHFILVHTHYSFRPTFISNIEDFYEFALSACFLQFFSMISQLQVAPVFLERVHDGVLKCVMHTMQHALVVMSPSCLG